MKCSICDSISLSTICGIDDFYVSGDNFELMQCNQCGAVLTNFNIDKAMFEKYYTHQYYAHTPNTQKLHHRDKIQLNSLKLQMREKLPTFEKWCTKFLRNFILVNIPYKKNGRILDIGCGIGNLLNVAKEVGFMCTGVEPSATARCILNQNGHIAYEQIGDLKEMKATDNYFDVIIFNQSLEHMADPLQSLIAIRPLLKPDGLLIVSVPNYACNERRVFREYWRHLDIPRHLHHFTPSILDKILQKAGFTIYYKKFKFWGFPGATFKMAKRKLGLGAIWLLFLYSVKQIASLITWKKEAFGQMMSVYLRLPNEPS
jgi:2-polyprenyl-3-methyl-5-hydroxy-6-metoxy-1,4-benzoquinol methylase